MSAACSAAASTDDPPPRHGGRGGFRARQAPAAMPPSRPVRHERSRVTEDTLLGGRVLLRQPADGYRVAIDPIFLAAAVPAAPGELVLDVGAGVGAAALCLAWREPNCLIRGIEIAACAGAARRRECGAERQRGADGVHGRRHPAPAAAPGARHLPSCDGQPALSGRRGGDAPGQQRSRHRRTWRAKRSWRTGSAIA